MLYSGTDPESYITHCTKINCTLALDAEARSSQNDITFFYDTGSEYFFHVPLSSESGTYETVKATFLARNRQGGFPARRQTPTLDTELLPFRRTTSPSSTTRGRSTPRGTSRTSTSGTR
jgi:hypothetical protein